jgi:hypothetical protein
MFQFMNYQQFLRINLAKIHHQIKINIAISASYMCKIKMTEAYI